jgi:hypothetical protein
MKCPKCGGNEVDRVVVWKSKIDNHIIGLGFAYKDGEVCCSFNESKYKTEAQAQEVIDTTTFEQFCADEFQI